MSETKSARRTQTRDRLVDAAAQVFADKGVLGASVEEICEAAGFTRGAFYSNFESKDDLCLALLEHQADQTLSAVRDALVALEAPASVDPDAESIDDFIDRAITLFLRIQPSDRTAILAGAELRLYAARSESLRPGYRAFEQRATSAFGAIITDAAAAFGCRLTLPAPQAISVLHGIYEQGAMLSLIEGDADTVASRSRLLSTVLRSFLTPA